MKVDLSKVKPYRACKCKNPDCGKKYNAITARGDLRGYCSAKCQHARAKQLGFRKSIHRFESQVLRHDGVGDDPWDHGAIVAVGFDSDSKVYVIRYADGDMELRNVSDFEKEVGKEGYRNLCGVAAHHPNRLMNVTKDLKLTGTEFIL